MLSPRYEIPEYSLQSFIESDCGVDILKGLRLRDQLRLSAVCFGVNTSIVSNSGFQEKVDNAKACNETHGRIWRILEAMHKAFQERDHPQYHDWYGETDRWGGGLWMDDGLIREEDHHHWVVRAPRMSQWITYVRPHANF